MKSKEVMKNQNPGIRRCPNCGKYYTLNDHKEEYFKLGEKTFVCKNCETVLSYNKTSERLMILVPIILSFLLAEILREFFDISFGLLIIIYLVFYVSVFLISTLFVKYDLVQK